jgi:hypothetical protein
VLSERGGICGELRNEIHHWLDREQERLDGVALRSASQAGAGRKGTTVGASPRGASNARAFGGKEATTYGRAVNGGKTGESRAGLRWSRKKQAGRRNRKGSHRSRNETPSRNRHLATHPIRIRRHASRQGGNLTKNQDPKRSIPRDAGAVVAGDSTLAPVRHERISRHRPVQTGIKSLRQRRPHRLHGCTSNRLPVRYCPSLTMC